MLDPINGNPVMQQSFTIHGDGSLLASTNHQYADVETLPEPGAAAPVAAAAIAMALRRRA